MNVFGGSSSTRHIYHAPIDRYGAQKLPVGNRIQDWPVTYDDLEPYYDQFEYDIGASGYGGNINGTLRQGGNIFAGPRTRDYPHPPLVRNRASEMFWNACQELGYHPFPVPAAQMSRLRHSPRLTSCDRRCLQLSGSRFNLTGAGGVSVLTSSGRRSRIC